jgi:hypothetical protein
LVVDALVVITLQMSPWGKTTAFLDGPLITDVAGFSTVTPAHASANLFAGGGNDTINRTDTYWDAIRLTGR